VGRSLNATVPRKLVGRRRGDQNRLGFSWFWSRAVASLTDLLLAQQGHLTAWMRVMAGGLRALAAHNPPAGYTRWCR
jgi:hypothetical protein